ncbi:AcrR family transcriptional regulator [Catenulispora sp. GP43]|uniref:TetR family transcriptional regulator n=1 Tax=Catenulispora sp. GP43 TaxID=3156263 RepID=UPI003513DDBC
MADTYRGHPAPGLRARKRQQTETKLWTTAIRLFLDRGFDQVSVADIAAATELSRVTVFNYFPTKEDLVFGPIDVHLDEPARAVRERPVGSSALDALRDRFLAGLDRFDPVTGLNDAENVVNVVGLIRQTPALFQRSLFLTAQMRDRLAAELVAEAPDDDPLTAALAAAQFIAVAQCLATDNQTRVLAGERAIDVLPDARRKAIAAYDQVEHGLKNYRIRH